MPLSDAQGKQLQSGAEQLLHLFNTEPSADLDLLKSAQVSLAKAIAPTFEIVFAGAFSAGKSMLINALYQLHGELKGIGAAFQADME